MSVPSLARLIGRQQPKQPTSASANISPLKLADKDENLIRLRHDSSCVSNLKAGHAHAQRRYMCIVHAEQAYLLTF